MNSLQIIAAIIGLGANIPLLIGIYRNKIEQNFAAFALWASLDWIASISTCFEHGNFWLPLGYACGATTVAISLAIKRQVSWSWVETTTLILVAICIAIWATSGNAAGTVASSLAVIIASIPQAVDTFKKPASTPTGIYSLFLVANVLSFIAGKSWTIEERFYSGCVVFLTAILIVLSLRKPKK